MKRSEREVAALCEMLGENEFNTHWSVGRKLTMDEAIQLALKSSND